MISYSEPNFITNVEISELEKLSGAMFRKSKENERSYSCLTLNSEQKEIFLKKILVWVESTYDIKLLSYSPEFYDSYMIYYYKDDFFSKHHDNQFMFKHKMKRKYVVGFHLNNDYEGGEYFLYYNNTKYEIDKTVGVVYTFDSELEHEITPITSSVRKSVVIFVNEQRIINNKHKNLI